MRGISGLFLLAVLAIACGNLEGSQVPDGGASDGGSSSSSGTAPAPPPTCEAKRCYTFDGDAGPPAFSFDATALGKSGALSLLTDSPYSAPRSLLAKVQGTAALPAGYAVGVTTIGARPTTLTTSFRLKVLTYDPGTDASAHVVSLGCAGNDTGAIFVKVTDPTHLGIKQDGTTGGPDATQALPGPIQAWSRIEVGFVAVSEGSYQVSVSFEGTPYFVGQPPSTAFTCSTLEVRHGIRPADVNSTTAHYEIAFDDILVDWH